MVYRKLLNYFLAPMTEAITVRSMTEEDLNMVLAWRNHPVVRSFMLTQHEIGVQEHRNWFERVKQDKNRKQLIVLTDSEPIGFVQFSPVCQDGIAEWGFYARPDAPKGSGTKLGQAALRHAFQDFRLHKVCGQSIEANSRSINFHRKMGFTEEGCLRDQIRIGNQYHTLFCFGLLAKDWKNSQQT